MRVGQAKEEQGLYEPDDKYKPLGRIVCTVAVTDACLPRSGQSANLHELVRWLLAGRVLQQALEHAEDAVVDAEE